MRKVLPDVLLICGLTLMTYAVRMIHPAAGWFFLGGMLFLMGLAPTIIRSRSQARGRKG
jgi:hypothetical protein